MEFAAIFGAVSGGLSCVALILIIGMYKERIDRHERWFNLLVDESLIRAWKSGAVDRGSFHSKADVLATFPDDILAICQKAAKRLTGREQYKSASTHLLRALHQHNPSMADLSDECGLTPLELLGALVTYTVELASDG
ncbi:hypothetical protein LCGC14_1938560 [marine sediment metagenome]|uniref:Uncharacterized protein n=1 Tax=marine sediment metagenome TaxID=412755 RepID=A0A0F9FKX6_9ZZZZ